MNGCNPYHIFPVTHMCTFVGITTHLCTICQGETEGVTSEEYQEEQRRSQNNHYPQHRHQDDAEGFGVELDQPRRGMMSDLSTSIRQRFQARCASQW